MWPDPAVLAACLCLALAVLPGFARAQDGTDGQGATDPAGPALAADPVVTADPPPLLTLNQDRLFKESAWGRAALERAESDGKALAAENRRIEDALETEERSLTERRATMNAADFSAATSAFDVKVEEIRAAQDGKTRSIQRRIEDDRKRFFDAATPILGDILAESGATAILADNAIVMSLSALDITNAAIARIDVALPPPAVAAPTEPPAPDPAQDGTPLITP